MPARLAPLLLLLACALLFPSQATAQSTDLRLRVAWGGGTSRPWQGQLRVDDGQLSELVYLGLEADEAATVYLEKDTLLIRHRAAQSYDGFDVLVRATLSAKLHVELSPAGQPQEMRRIDVPLASLVADFYHSQLDDQGNQLLIQRAPGDALRLNCDRDSMVFSPREPFEFQLSAHHLGIEDGASLRCLVELTGNRGGEQLWSADKDFVVRADPDGERIGPFTVELPEKEGVYEVVASVHRKRFGDRFVRSKPVLQRKIQLVVVDSEAPASRTEEWTLVDEIDPLNPSWMEWLSNVPKLPLLPDFHQGPLGSGKADSREHAGNQLIQMAAGAWRAYPLPIDTVARPHILEIEYPSDIPQTLGISIIEPNAAGQVVPIGLDSGVDVSDAWATGKPRMLRHRLLFWPRTEAPLVLLTNRRARHVAAFGTIRVYAGPENLPTAEPSGMQAMARDATNTGFKAAAGNQGDVDGSTTPPRFMAAYFDKPLFPENFSASESADAWSGRSLDDWVTFHEGATRFVQYLKYTGYNGAIVSVACEGSTIYPSQYLTPNPKYDTGLFFASGQDPMRKDVLELLFRLFDREGLRLVPAVQFSSPLAALEKQRRGQPEQAVGIDLVDRRGRMWTDLTPARRGMAPYYNPLDPRVQSAMRDVMAEISDRYSRHASFAGVSLQLGPDTYTVFPSDQWGSDATTVARFEKDAGYTPTEKVSGDDDGFRTRDKEKTWLTWRALELAGFYKAILGDATERRPDAQLYLAGGDLFISPISQRLLRPTLPNHPAIEATLLHLGIDPQRLTNQPRIVLLRPDRIAPESELASQAVNVNLATNPAAEEYFGGVEPAASLFFHEPMASLALPSFDRSSPFGSDNTHTVLVMHVAPSETKNRERFARRLATRDLQCMVDGGWMIPLGQEESLRPLLTTLSQLPNMPFETVAPQDPALLNQPLVVRRLEHDGRTYLYIVNQSPWSVSAELELNAPESCSLEAIGARAIAAPAWSGPQLTVPLEIEPFDVVAAVLNSAQVTVETWRVTIDDQAYAQLQQQVNSAHSRAGMLHRPMPVDWLANAGFEMSPDKLPGWRMAEREGTSIAPDATEKYEGKQSLKMSSRGAVAWIRSDPIPVPQSGRISVMVRVKTLDAKQQPPLRLAIEGRLNGQTYYRFANVGANGKPLSAEWGEQPFLVHIDDLPVSGLTDLQIGFDLMGAGQVWIDQVQVYDMWFLPNERDELMIKFGLAKRALSKGEVTDCLRVLSGYWSKFLDQNVTAGELRTAALPPAVPTTDETPSNSEKKSSVLDKVKSLPKRVFPF